MEDIYVLGVDIGGSHIACQLVNLSDCSLIENTYAEVKVAENQSAGIILAESYGEIIIDRNIKAPADCELKLWDNRTCFSA